MFSKKCFCKASEIGYYPVIAISPVGGIFKTVARLTRAIGNRPYTGFEFP
jgi:hypothetical protein